MNKKHIVVFSGAGISAESGLSTFRDSGGLWENNKIEDVATPDAWIKNPSRVLEFYNLRFQQLSRVLPNKAHLEIAKLESNFNVSIVTQNVDDLHERAGSTKVIHLHGELKSCRCSKNLDETYPMPSHGLEIGMNCPDGHQLRPNIVWFGEAVPNIDLAHEVITTADYLIIIGTSLNVYPAAGLIHFTNDNCKTLLIDPNYLDVQTTKQIIHIREKATIGIASIIDYLK